MKCKAEWLPNLSEHLSSSSFSGRTESSSKSDSLSLSGRALQQRQRALGHTAGQHVRSIYAPKAPRAEMARTPCRRYIQRDQNYIPHATRPI